MKAYDAQGRPRVVKFVKDGLLPSGSSEPPEGTEAAAVMAIRAGHGKAKVFILPWALQHEVHVCANTGPMQLHSSRPFMPPAP